MIKQNNSIENSMSQIIRDDRAEKAVLGIYMLDGVAPIGPGMSAQVFYEPKHRHIFDAISIIHNEGKPANLITVIAKLQEAGILEQCGGPGYVSSLTTLVPTAVSIAYFEKQVLDCYKRRTFDEMLKGKSEQLRSPGAKFDDIEQDFKERLDALDRINDTDEQKRVGAWDDFETKCKEYNPDKDFRPSLGAGLAFPDGTLSYIGARTGRGKTTIMLNLAREALFMKNPRRVLFVTLEENREALLRKLILSLAYSTASTEERTLLDTRAGNQTEGKSIKGDFYTVMRGEHGLSGPGAGELYRLISAARDRIKDFYGKNLIIYEAQGLQNLEQVTAAINRNTHAGDIVLIDYVQRLPGPVGFTATNFMLGKAQSNALFNMAKNTGTVIISGAQFNRAATAQGGKEKEITLDGVQFEDFEETGFRESGDIEQDAHNALGIGRDTDTKQKRYLKILKTREDAADGVFNLDFKGAYAFMANTGRPDRTKFVKNAREGQQKKTSQSQDNGYNIFAKRGK
jgi:replicative DNA helicase